ncbi:MAG: hypothetical protein KKA05_11835 [Alphaproteobacteria bacterium]|nr:hypothetical protein [Alphaproteobacteria bacterium]
MKIGNILFKAAMINACRRGLKTETRRALSEDALAWMDEFTGEFVADPENGLSPYGYAGDLLWARETHHLDVAYDGLKPSLCPPEAAVFYVAGGQVGDGVQGKKRVAIHMTRWASRLTLELTSVRIEALHNIDEAGAIAEGITVEHVIVGANCNGGRHGEEWADRAFFDGGDEEGYETAVDAYKALWIKINGQASWDENPWVWVICFKPHNVNVDAFLKERANEEADPPAAG